MLSPQVVVVDSGVANLTSVMTALARLNVDAEVTDNAEKIKKAPRVILPGVGSAVAAMAQLEAKKLTDVLRRLTLPVLGICLGMQLLFARSDEGAGQDCLGILPGNVKHLPITPDMPVPHMGWNQVKINKADHPLLRGIEDESFVSFVHSYAAPVGDYTLASCDYIEQFSAVVGCKNFLGCQFHPERSGVIGQKILKNFLEM